MSGPASYVLVMTCPDQRGIVSAVSTFLSERGASITESSQFDEDGAFFMRTAFRMAENLASSIGHLDAGFEPIAKKFSMNIAFFEGAAKPKVLIAVSRFGHCLYDLLHRWRSGLLKIEVAGVVSNHDDMRSFVEWNALPYFHLPVEPGRKAIQEDRFLDVVAQLKPDLVVLARYMQILSERMCAALSGRCINIHHSFLPSFKGARPYHQAHARGVKMIGATAHYVTTDLDEGPIIAQDARHISHALRPEQLVALGQEVEAAVLSRAVKWHVERRIIITGCKTIVFS